MPTAAIDMMTPAYALAAVPFAAALVAALYAGRRASAARSALGLGRPPRRWLLLDLALVAAGGGLLALACAQPAIWRERTAFASRDAEVAFVVDVSRSMLAASGPDQPTRLERSRELALRLREAAPAVPVGLVSLTDRTFPHAFPDTDLQLFRDAVGQAIRIQEPPPRFLGSVNATDLRALRQLAVAHYFRDESKRRAIVVFTDAETAEAPSSFAGYFSSRGVRVSVVRIWSLDERVWDRRGRPEPYRPSQAMLPAVTRFVEETGGKVYEERDAEELAGALRKLGTGGPQVARGTTREPRPLAPYLVGLAVLPLGGWFRRRSRA
jgi:VWA domain-containing protein